jgi:transposase
MEQGITVGMDMGDKNHRVVALDASGEVVDRRWVSNTAPALRNHFKTLGACRVAVEAGTHSGWVSRLLEEMGHEVLVGNPRRLRVIWDSDRKDDDRDAETLARIARVDPNLLHPIHHRGAEAQADLAVIKARAALVATRTRLIASARGLVKTSGHRIDSCGAEVFHKRLVEQMPSELVPALEPMLKIIEDLTVRIRHYDNTIRELSDTKYPETKILRQIAGVGPITSLAFILTLENADRFKKSRDVGCYVGLTPKRDQSGQSDKQLAITKAGNADLRRLLVGCAQYILGHYAKDSELRRFGLNLAARGGKNAKRRAVVAVARKLAVLMHHLWVTGETYDPFFQQNARKKKVA